ncbi:MAG: 1-deoxy-D-xylulose-5-phosphate reductoisomerase [Rhodothermales bacterium]
MLPRLDRPTRLHADAPRGLAILGSTGSIGTQTLEIVRLFPERFRIVALTAHANADLLAKQARAFRPDFVVIGDEARAATLRDALDGLGVLVLVGPEGLEAAATAEGVETVVAAVVGFAGLRPTVAAIRAGKEIALANKETLVVAGELVQRLVEAHETAVLPVDSEHSALFQCLVGEPPDSIESITLTASGGPFRTRPAATFGQITRAEALAHPNWEMGAKITIDSATMMNKGLEVIEARWMFDLAPEQIDVLVHPQSVIHSLVHFRDGSVKAQLGVPDMRVPIQYALSFPERWPAPHPRLDWSQIACLDFEEPDLDRFPCLRLAFDALAAGGTAPAVLNAANEAAVALFLDEQIGFADIPRLVEAALERADSGVPHSLDALEAVDAEARARVRELHGSLTF